MRLGYNPSTSVKKTGSFARGRDASLGENPIRIRPAEDISLRPGRDRCGTPIENDGTTGDSNSDWDVVEFNVVEHERTSETSVAGLGGSDEDWSIGDDGVDDGLSTGRLPKKLR